MQSTDNNIMMRVETNIGYMVGRSKVVPRLVKAGKGNKVSVGRAPASYAYAFIAIAKHCHQQGAINRQRHQQAQQMFYQLSLSLSEVTHTSLFSRWSCKMCRHILFAAQTFPVDYQ
jgi:hypothetical protein